MTIFTVGFTVLAALLHIYIWVLESFRRPEPARKTFGVSESDARVLACSPPRSCSSPTTARWCGRP